MAPEKGTAPTAAWNPFPPGADSASISFGLSMAKAEQWKNDTIDNRTHQAHPSVHEQTSDAGTCTDE